MAISLFGRTYFAMAILSNKLLRSLGEGVNYFKIKSLEKYNLSMLKYKNLRNAKNIIYKDIKE